MKGDDQRSIVLQAWKTYQDLIQGMGENCWKIRSVFYTAAFGLLAAGFSADMPLLYVLVPFLALAFYLMESGYRRLQHQYVLKTADIERTLNDMLAGEAAPRFPDAGVSTSLATPTVGEFFRQLGLRHYLVWLPYLIMAVTALSLFAAQITHENATKTHVTQPAPSGSK